MATVYAADQGLQLQNETVEAIMYDDAALLLLVIKGGVVFAYDVAMDIPTQHEQLVWTYPLQDGPPVICARCSLDRQLLALQRSRLLVEMVDLPSGNISVTQSDKGRSELLGMFFSEWSEAQVVLLSRAGLEMCTLAARRQGLHSRERLRLPIHWYQYSHETRCCLVATGPPLGAPYMQAWQFVSTGLITLPPFALAASALGTAPSMTPPVPISNAATAPALPSQPSTPAAATNPTTTSNGAPSPPPPGVPVLPISTPARSGDETAPAGAVPIVIVSTQAPNPVVAVGAASAPQREEVGSKPRSSGLAAWMGGGGAVADVLTGAAMLPGNTPGAPPPLWPNMLIGATGTDAMIPSSQVKLLKMYGRVYCAHVNAGTGKLDLYRLFTDTVVLQFTYELPSPRVQLSVVDNVLVAQQVSTGAALLIDVCADVEKPVVQALPLGHLAPLRRPRQLQEERLQQQLQRQARAAAGAGAMLGARGPLPPPTAWSVVDEEGRLRPHKEWQFHMPNLVVDVKSQVVYRMLLDLTAVSRDPSASPAVLAAFLQRRRAPRLHVVPLDSLAPISPLSPRPLSALEAADSIDLPTSPSPAASSASQLDLSALTLSSGLSANSQQLAFNLTHAPSGCSGVGPGSARSGAGSDLAAGQSAGSADEKRVSTTELLLGSPHPHPVMLSGLVTPTAIPSKLLLLQLIRRLLLEESSLPILRGVFEAIAKAYAEVALAASMGRASAAASACVLSPSEMVDQVLTGLSTTLMTPARHTYMQAVIAELVAAVADVDAPVPASLQLLALQLLMPTRTTSDAPQMPSPTYLTLPDGLPLLYQGISTELLVEPMHATIEIQAKPGSGSMPPEAAANVMGGALARALHCGMQSLALDMQPQQLRALGSTAAVEAANALCVVRQAVAAVAGATQKPGASGPSGGTTAATPPAPTTSALQQPPVDAGADSANQQQPGVELVQLLLRQGRFAKAARVARELRVTAVLPQEFAGQAAAVADHAMIVAVYRCYRTALQPMYSNCQAMQRALCP